MIFQGYIVLLCLLLLLSNAFTPELYLKANEIAFIQFDSRSLNQGKYWTASAIWNK